MLDEGWYLMSTGDLERELARERNPDADAPPSNAVKLTVEQGLAFRDAGNIPDDKGRTLRLVLRIEGADELTRLDEKRLLYEPDFHERPGWRRSGSKPVNVVPLRASEVSAEEREAWWDRPELKTLEDEWRASGTVEGMRVPAAYRGFVYKTVLSLKAAGLEVTPDSVAGSITRWLSSEESEQLRAALGGDGGESGSAPLGK
jgi:hypothetical protein